MAILAAVCTFGWVNNELQVEGAATFDSKFLLCRAGKHRLQQKCTGARIEFVAAK